jgi:hypothetical protein
MDTKFLTGVVAAFLLIAFVACIWIIVIIVFWLPTHLKSTSYRFILAAKISLALLCGSGFYLILWPLKSRVILVSLLWFADLALGVILSATGFSLYARDVNIVLRSGYDNLPVVPETSETQHTTRSTYE